MSEEAKNYLTELVSKFSFIQGISVTDQDGGTLMMHLCEKTLKNIEDGEKSGEKGSDDQKEQKLNFSFNMTQYLSSSLDQISKIEKWKTKYIVSIYDQFTFFQSKFKNFFIHIMCDTKQFNYELVKEIIVEFQAKIAKIEKDVEQLNFGSEIIN